MGMEIDDWGVCFDCLFVNAAAKAAGTSTADRGAWPSLVSCAVSVGVVDDIIGDDGGLWFVVG